MGKWEMTKKPVLIQIPIDPKIYHEKLLAIAKALYLHVRGQLVPSLVPSPIGTYSSHDVRANRRSHE